MELERGRPDLNPQSFDQVWISESGNDIRMRYFFSNFRNLPMGCISLPGFSLRLETGCTLTFLPRPPTMIVSYSFRSAVRFASPGCCGIRIADGPFSLGRVIFRRRKSEDSKVWVWCVEAGAREPIGIDPPNSPRNFTKRSCRSMEP